MKRGLAVLVLLVAAGGALWWAGRRGPMPAPGAAGWAAPAVRAEPAPVAAGAGTGVVAGTVVAADSSETASAVVPVEAVTTPPAEALKTEPPSQDPQVALEAVTTVIRDYRLRLGGNPVGSNAEITAALGGKNARQANFLSGEPLGVNQKGELVDPWGTPLFLHQESGDVMEVRSAGPDRRMWTGDDVVRR